MSRANTRSRSFSPNPAGASNDARANSRFCCDKFVLMRPLVVTVATLHAGASVAIIHGNMRPPHRNDIVSFPAATENGAALQGLLTRNQGRSKGIGNGESEAGGRG